MVRVFYPRELARKQAEYAALPVMAVEFIMRDVYTVHGDLGRPRRVVELARRACAHAVGA